MEGEWGEQPKIPETEATSCAKVLSRRLRIELPTLLGVHDLNFSLISKDRQTVRMNFYPIEGKEFTDAQWKLVKEYTRVVFSEIVVTPYDDTPINDSVEIDFDDCDAQYDYKRSIIIRTK